MRRKRMLKQLDFEVYDEYAQPEPQTSPAPEEEEEEHELFQDYQGRVRFCPYHPSSLLIAGISRVLPLTPESLTTALATTPSLRDPLRSASPSSK